MKKKMLYSITTIVLIAGLGAIYYYYPRNVSFEFTMEIQKPSKEFDNSQFIGFDYIDSKDNLRYRLVDWFKDFYPQEQIYDTIFVQNLAKELDFKKYDYIITYQKQLKSLRHSPYLTNTKDGLYYIKEIPLFPTFYNVITDNVYIYGIKKNNKYRSFGP